MKDETVSRASMLLAQHHDESYIIQLAVCDYGKL